MAYQPKFSKARFVLGPFSAEDMTIIGSFMCDRIRRRIQSGMNAEDGPAKPLKPGKNGKRGYPQYKAAHGRAPIRDWTWTGRTLRSLVVKSASENHVAIGFSDEHSDMVAHVNNRRERAFGVSPADRKALGEIVLATLRRLSPVRFRKVA